VESSNRREGIPTERIEVLRGIWSHRFLIVSLVRREFRIRYRQSLAGFGWAIVPSLVTLAAATVVFRDVAKIDTGQVPYPVFAFAALAPWTFFANSLSSGVTSVTRDSQMVTRLPFPRIALPLAMIGASFADLAIASATFVVFAYVTGNPLPLTAAWYPFLLVVEIVFATGVVLFLSGLNVFARDVKVAVPVGIQLWLFLTPVLYPLSAVPSNLRSLYLLNPMTGLVESFRRVLVFGQGIDWSLMALSILGAFVALVVGTWYFGATEKRFADVV
jgi:lipopolysaccharide transport system permease protein